MKKFIFGLLFSAISLVLSAFYSNGKMVNDMYVTYDGINYIYISANDYDGAQCVRHLLASACSYYVTPAGAPYISRTVGFNATQLLILEYVNGYICHLSTDHGIYSTD